MEAEERPMDWATREAEKEQREAQEAEEAREKSERDKHLKDEGGIMLFGKLHAWMEGQAKSYSGKIPEQAFEVGTIKPWGGPDPYDFFEVSKTNRDRPPMKVSYHSTPGSGPHRITVDCGVLPKPEYPLSVRDDGNVFFETRKGQSRTIEELGSELLESFKAVRRF
ncbi:MAG: hypothetical protein P4K93_09365 [Terracidiphilus sp.]|nr:hypothetical protein [Terracidiphilus sp.]MDR3798349.1 hypothetical protein [Terracidiphilus sp.]